MQEFKLNTPLHNCLSTEKLHILTLIILYTRPYPIDKSSQKPNHTQNLQETSLKMSIIYVRNTNTEMELRAALKEPEIPIISDSVKAPAMRETSTTQQQYIGNLLAL